MTSLLRLFRKSLMIMLALGAVLVTGSVLWLWYTNSGPQGGGGFFCDSVKIDLIDNEASEWIVSGHNTVCSGFGGNSAIYIYVHPAREKEGREFLVFRYFEHGGANLPRTEWVGKNRLLISVEHVSQVTKMVSSMGPVSISYQIAKEDYPRPM